MSRLGPGHRAEDCSPLLMWKSCLIFPLPLTLISTHHLLTATSWVWEEAGPTPTQGRWNQVPFHVLSRCCSNARHHPLLVCTPSSLGMTHRLPQVGAAIGRQSQVSQVSVLFSAREAHDMSKCILWYLAEGAQRVDQTSGLE